MKGYIGVDIGATALRAVRVGSVDREGFAVIDAFAVAPFKPDVVVAGRVRQAQVVAHGLLRALEAVGSSGDDVILGAAPPDVAVNQFELPPGLSPGERVKAIRAKNVQIGPAVPVSEATLASSFVRSQHVGEGRQVDVVAVAAVLREELSNLLSVCRIADVHPRGVDLSGAGLVRSLVRDAETSRDVSTIVDIGATQTTVVTREGLDLRSIRSFTGGGADLTRAIAQATKEEFGDAERRKYSMRLPAVAIGVPIEVRTGYGGLEDDELVDESKAQTTLEGSLSSTAELLVDQVAQAIELDAANLNVLTRQVSLTGGTALMRGMKERLQRRLGVEVLIGHPWARLARTKDHERFVHNGQEDPRLMLSLATAAGLSLWRLES